MSEEGAHKKKRGRESSPVPFPLQKIISGGQTGADLAALKAAKTLGMQTGGTAFVLLPKGEKNKNVDDADATLAFRVKSSPGTDKTIRYAHKKEWKPMSKKEEEHADADVWEQWGGHRPFLVIRNPESDSAKRVLVDFIQKHGVKTLNVAGHRAAPDLPEWEERIERFLVETLKPFF